ncbi:MAG: DNA polymerase III subunit chi [Gammaproteobacteria bacterium]|jgi:DNA polymerase-3 subunit chi|nr:DNA polymerase III subunit chi [Gammaproteobacteria bacterium]
MTQIDFYILSDTSPNAGALFACKLVEKAYHLKHTIYVNTHNQPQAEHLDELLWTFNQGSFLPHTLNVQQESCAEPIVIGNTDQSTTFHDVLINLDQQVPAFFSQFERVAEIVSGDDAARNQGRQRYKFYRDRGYALNTHNIG